MNNNELTLDQLSEVSGGILSWTCGTCTGNIPGMGPRIPDWTFDPKTGKIKIHWPRKKNRPERTNQRRF